MTETVACVISALDDVTSAMIGRRLF